MNLIDQLTQIVADYFKATYAADLDPTTIELEETPANFEGDYTLVLFPYLKRFRCKLPDLARHLSTYFKKSGLVEATNLIKGFLNLSLRETVWQDVLKSLHGYGGVKPFESKQERIMIEFSSPNTNKPLHLGHLRNNFLGDSLARILEFYGYELIKTCLVNDRGIHICKSMVAYQEAGKGEVPKGQGDKLVGSYYIKFEQILKAQIRELLSTGQAKDAKAAENQAPILKAAQVTLEKWEAEDPAVRALWAKMNSWVYAGFDQTYRSIGIEFHKIYKESETYELGQKNVYEGLEKNIFYKKSDGSTWVDLTDHKLDHKLLLRANGTSVYITQDIGTCDLKYADFQMTQSLFVVGNEQDYHFKVLKAIVQKLGRPYAAGIKHISYGMVDLPSGKMKSREGTVVDADDLIADMKKTAAQRTRELGKIEDFSQSEQETLYHDIAIGALKYYLLKVESHKRILFNPTESINFQGNTGVYLQYNYAKIQAIVARAGTLRPPVEPYQKVHKLEKRLLQACLRFPKVIEKTAARHDPSILANFTFDLAKTYSRFYAELPIFNQAEAIKTFRVQLSEVVGYFLKTSLNLMGIKELEKI